MRHLICYQDQLITNKIVSYVPFAVRGDETAGAWPLYYSDDDAGVPQICRQDNKSHNYEHYTMEIRYIINNG